MTSELHEIVRRARNLSESTRGNYLRDLDRWLVFAGEHPSGWTPIRVQDFYDHLVDTEGLKPQSATRLITSVQFASKWRAHFANKPELDFAANVQKERAQFFKKRHALERETIVKLLESIRPNNPDEIRDFAIITTLLETGMRRMSLVSMNVEQTLIDAKQLQGTRYGYPMAAVLIKGSGDQRFDVPLSDTATLTIARWRDWLKAPKGPLFRGLDERLSPQGQLGLIASKAALGVDAINKMVKRRADAAGVGHIHPHQFRHTFVTWRLAAGLQLYEVSAITRHAVKSGNIFDYVDNEVIGQKVRNSTPDWLKELVQRWQ